MAQFKWDQKCICLVLSDYCTMFLQNKVAWDTLKRAGFTSQ